MKKNDYGVGDTPEDRTYAAFWTSMMAHDCCGGYDKGLFTSSENMCASKADFKPTLNVTIEYEKKDKDGPGEMSCALLNAYALEGVGMLVRWRA